ncbi:CamS family sex pheromone protein [Bacillus sp. SCS-153A]|uniref:CamS family sex pheromone protein n=1 Tax=Rossellomorea sedimentorum TaxID=3115294 RepID=UPI0039063C9B
MKKRLIATSTGLMLILSGCTFLGIPDKSENENTNLVTQQSTSENETNEYLRYQVKSSVFSKNRELITYQVNNRVDMNEIETGLMSLSEDYFPADKFIYQEGQYLDEIGSWIRRKSNDELGLNPAIEVTEDMGWEKVMELSKEKPIYLGYVHEQNYVDQKGNLKGLSIGLAMNSVDYISVNDNMGLKHFDMKEISEKKMISEGKKMAEIIINRVRQKENLQNIPIVISLFELEKKNSVLPGSYFTYAYLDANDKSIKKWREIEKQDFLFPSNAAEEHDRVVSNRLKGLEEDMNAFFPDRTIQLVSKGTYIESDLQKMVINVNTDMTKYGEIVGFVQAFAPEIQDFFPHEPVYIYVKTPEGTAATVLVEPEEEPAVHIHDSGS